MVDKLKILVALFVLACGVGAWPSSGQKYNGSSPVAAYSGPGDIVTSAVAWYGLRAYSLAVANSNAPAVNIIRASDSHTCDVLLASSGGLGVTANCSTPGDNGQSAPAFCNATTCSAVTVYDQTVADNCAGTCNAIQGTPANQPTLTFNCVSSLPCLTGAGSQLMASALSLSPSIAQPFTITNEAERTSGTGLQMMLGEKTDGSGDVGMYFNNSANFAAIYAGTVVPVTATDGLQHSFVGVYNGASSVFVVDGSATTGLNPNTRGLASMLGIIGNTNSQDMNGNWFEGGMWASGFNGTQYANMATNMNNYY